MALATTELEISAIAAHIKEDTNDLGTLCSSNNINMWSRWKPVDSATEDLNIDELRIINYGLSYTDTKYSRPDQLVNSINANTTSVKYNKPNGNINSPYRIGDFRNYNHYAYNPCGTGVAEGYIIQTIKKGTSGMKTVFSLMEMEGSAYQIGLSDLKELFGYASDTMYYCVILKQGDKLWWTSSSDFVTIQWDTNLSLKAATGTFEVYMCLCNKNFNNVIKEIVSYSDEEYYPIIIDKDNINPYQINLTNESGIEATYYVSFDIYIEDDICKYNVNIQSKKGTSIFDTIHFEVFDKDPIKNSGSNSFGFVSVSNDRFSLNEGEMKTISGVFEISGSLDRPYFYGGSIKAYNYMLQEFNGMIDSGPIVNYGESPQRI